MIQLPIIDRMPWDDGEAQGCQMWGPVAAGWSNPPQAMGRSPHERCVRLADVDGERWSGRGVCIALALLWIAASLAIKPFYPYLDFGVFYSTALDRVLAGQILDIYGFVARAPGSDLALPLTNPPHYILLLTPVYALGKLLGFADFHQSSGISFGQAWMLLATLPFDLLLCREVVLLVEKWKGPLSPRVRCMLFLCVLYAPVLWLSSVRFGHNESMMVALALWAIRSGEEGKPVRAGVLWGVAAGIKLTVMAPALVWFFWGMRGPHRRHVLMASGIGSAVFLIPVIPFILWRFDQIWYALVGFESIRPVGGFVFWKLAPFPQWMVDASGMLILAISVGLGLILARRKDQGFLGSGGAYALVLSQVGLLLLGKGLFMWYGLALVAFAFIALRPIPALLVSLLAWLLQSGPWVGPEVTTQVQLRSAMWVAFLLGVGALTVMGWRSQRRLGAPASQIREDG